MCNEKLYQQSLIYYEGNFQNAMSRSFMFMNIFCTHLITESQGEFIKLILVLAGELDFLKNANDCAQTLINLQYSPACKRKMKGHFCPSFPFSWKAGNAICLCAGARGRFQSVGQDPKGSAGQRDSSNKGQCYPLSAGRCHCPTTGNLRGQHHLHKGQMEPCMAVNVCLRRVALCRSSF